jgi:hypothetical protein
LDLKRKIISTHGSIFAGSYRTIFLQLNYDSLITQRLVILTLNAFTVLRAEDAFLIALTVFFNTSGFATRAAFNLFGEIQLGKFAF